MPESAYALFQTASSKLTSAPAEATKAFLALKALADEGDAIVMLAVCYQCGYGCQISLADAYNSYIKAAKKNHKLSLRNLGDSYLYGKYELKQDATLGCFWLLQSLTQGLPNIESGFDNTDKLLEKLSAKTDNLPLVQLLLAIYYGKYAQPIDTPKAQRHLTAFTHGMRILSLSEQKQIALDAKSIITESTYSGVPSAEKEIPVDKFDLP